jgi:hypothetical protein
MDFHRAQTSYGQLALQRPPVIQVSTCTSDRHLAVFVCGGGSGGGGGSSGVASVVKLLVVVLCAFSDIHCLSSSIASDST